MATLTFYADTSDGYVASTDTTYLTARSGSGFSSGDTGGGGGIIVGQLLSAPNYQVVEGFVSFDTSAIASASITSVVLSLRGTSDGSATDFTINARLFDWGSSLTTADWVAGASLGGKTLLATRSTSGGFSTSSYNDFTSDSAFISNINTTGTTRIILSSSRHEAGDVPVGNEYVTIDAANTAGTTQDPMLVVVTAGGGGFPFPPSPMRAHIVR